MLFTGCALDDSKPHTSSSEEPSKTGPTILNLPIYWGTEKCLKWLKLSLLPSGRGMVGRELFLREKEGNNSLVPNGLLTFPLPLSPSPVTSSFFTWLLKERTKGDQIVKAPSHCVSCNRTDILFSLVIEVLLVELLTSWFWKFNKGQEFCLQGLILSSHKIIFITLKQSYRRQKMVILCCPDKLTFSPA